MATAPAPLQLVQSAATRPEEFRRRELAAFLRSRRERIAPEQVGLPAIGRRRTPGLRREEVAQLAAVGVTWYTWLEQARDIQVSASVLDAIARGLLLDSSERQHLFLLAGAPDPSPLRGCPTVTPAVHAVMAQLDPMPCVAVNARYDIVAYNRTYARLIGNLDEVAPEDRNLLLLAFTHPDWKRALVDYEAATSMMTAKFRSAMADHVAEPAWKALLKRLTLASPEFAEKWGQHEVGNTSNGDKRFLNPLVGLLHLEFTNLWLGPRESTRLVAYTPADDETRERLERLNAMTAAADE